MASLTEPGTPPSADYKDSKTGLIVFGILTMLAGGLCALFIPLMFFGQAMAPKSSPQPSLQMMLPGMVMYGVMAIALVWLGIGSIMARRWARAILLILSWSWLLMGVVAIAAMIYLMPLIMQGIRESAPAGQQPAMPAGSEAIFMWIPIVMMSVIMVFLPAVWIFFYRSRHVKATCEARDPVVRWTDRSPLPVIALSLWLAICVPMMVVMVFAYKGVAPFFGAFVSGPVGGAVYLLMAGVWAYGARGVYRLETRAWWIVLASVLLFATSAFVTYSRHDIGELYQLMGYPAEQIALIQKFNFFKGQTAAWLSVIGTVPFVLYLLFVRRYFHSRPPAPQAA
jgi:hypothetical protein